MRKSYGNLSFVVLALTVPVSMFVGAILEWWLKSRNPSNLDITAGLAYLRPLLVTSFTVALALLIASLVLALVGIKRDEDDRTARAALFTLIAVVVISLASLFAKSRVSKTEDNYRNRHLNSFFKTLGS